MVRFAVVFCLAFCALVAPAQATTIGQLIPAHSHWDVRNADHELLICYTPVARTDTAGSEIAFIPLREQDSQNFMQLSVMTSGFKLKKRIAGTFSTVTPITAVPQSHGVGSEIMFDWVEQGPDFYVYELRADLSRGALLYHWRDSQYSVGVNISYYTTPKWSGVWDFVHGHALDGVGMPHEIAGLAQDARNHPSQTGVSVFEDTTPAGGGISDITSRDVSTVVAGLASGANYTYTFDVAGSGTGYMDFRDPPDQYNEHYWANGFYRFTPSSPATIKRYTGSGTLAETHTASAGGPGSYKLTMTGHAFALEKAGQQILTFSDSGPTSGVRVRVRPSTQTWAFTGAPS